MSPPLLYTKLKNYNALSQCISFYIDLFTCTVLVWLQLFTLYTEFSYIYLYLYYICHLSLFIIIKTPVNDAFLKLYFTLFILFHPHNPVASLYIASELQYQTIVVNILVLNLRFSADMDLERFIRLYNT